MSGTPRKRPPSTSGAQVGPRSSKKQRLVDAVKMLLDITKESSDAFPPLKSCLGGISALIKHYDEYNGVKEKLNELVPRLEELLATLAKANPNSDREEVERRSQLEKSLDDIRKRSLALSEKGKVARVLDKARDSQEVINLVEELRQAILVYQISQQQWMQSQVAQMTSSFDALLKLHRKSPANKKLESVRARLRRLEVEGDAARNPDELRRRKTLFEALERIKDKLQSLSKPSTSTEHTESEGDITAASDLADDLRDAIVEYQFSQQEAIYGQNCRLIDIAELSVLNSCRRAKGAEFRHGDRQGCLKGTRGAVLDDIESWSKDFTMSPVYWLNGLAGTGKSTIAQTVAERIFADGRLGASFFCSHDFKDRRSLHYIFPTLAFQLAHKYPEFRSTLLPLLRSNPDIGHESLLNQMKMLIVEPLSSSNVPTVIIIDALDECADEDPQSAILSVMGRLVERIPNVKFFITGRPEPRIRSGFRLGLLRPLTDVFVLHEVEPSVVSKDIRLFIEHGLSELGKRKWSERGVWPTDEHLDLLCERAGGLFVYAVATLKFLDHPYNSPSKQLDIIARAPGSTTHEGKAKVRSSATLDSLYLSTFQTAFDGMDGEDYENVRFVIGTVVLAVNPLPPSAIATLVGLEETQVMNLLRLSHSLLKLSEDPDPPVLPFHKSFPDFITDPTRCPDKRFHISPGTGHLKLALSCLELMNEKLEQNLLSLPDYALNVEVEDLGVRVKNQISTALQYACKSWHNHLAEVSGDIVDIVPALRSFLQVGFLAWLEVLSVIGATRDAAVALEKLGPWLRKVALEHEFLDTANDYFQFVTKFFQVIDVSATHIYHSALELSPLSSIVRKFYYHRRLQPSPRVVLGVPDSWDPGTGAPSKQRSCLSSTWSPCGQFVAATAEAAVEIRDALTLELLSTLQLTGAATRFRRGLAYSPDGHSLAACSDAAIIIWDIQTGGEVTRIECVATRDGLEFVWSLDGKAICTISGPRRGGTQTVRTYRVASGTMLWSSEVQSGRGTHFWAHDKSFRVATTVEGRKGWTVTIFEVGSTLTEIESFPFQSHIDLKAFSPATHRICVSVTGNRDPELLVLGIHNSNILLRKRGTYRDPTFSPDGNLFAASVSDRLYVWRYTSSHYTQWREFQQILVRPQFSPTSSSILGAAGVLHVLRLDYSPVAFTTKFITATSRPYDAFSPDGTYIATAPHGGSTITITDLRPQNPSPSQFIDTDLEILAMILMGNVLLVKALDTLVAWVLTENGSVKGVHGDARAGRSDSLWEVSLRDANDHNAPLRGNPPDCCAGMLQWERDLLLERSGGRGVLAISVWEGITTIWCRHGHNICTYFTSSGKPILSSMLRNTKMPHADRLFCQDECDHYHLESGKRRGPAASVWPVTHTSLREGWVKDLEGKHRLWLHAHPRSPYSDVDWLYNTTTLRLRNISDLVVVKF